MHVLLNTDNNIVGREKLAEHVQSVIKNALGRFRGQITRVEVHLSDENGKKKGPNDKKCVIEARIQGRQPAAVSHQAATVHQALDGAAAKLQRLIDSRIGRRRAHPAVDKSKVPTELPAEFLARLG